MVYYQTTHTADLGAVEKICFICFLHQRMFAQLVVFVSVEFNHAFESQCGHIVRKLCSRLGWQLRVLGGNSITPCSI